MVILSSDLVHSKGSKLPVCDNPSHKQRKLQKWEEIENVWNNAWSGVENRWQGNCRGGLNDGRGIVLEGHCRGSILQCLTAWNLKTFSQTQTQNSSKVIT